MIELRVGGSLRTLDWEEWEDQVRAGRVAEDTPVRIRALTGDAFVPAGELESYRALRARGSDDLGQRLRRATPPLLTALLVGFQIRVWWVAQQPDVGAFLAEHFTKYTPATLETAEVWRVLTMGLLHVGFLHALMNLTWLAYTGWALERALGWRATAVIYTAAVAVGSLLSMAGAPDTPSMGASGGVFGLIAASVVFGFTRPDDLPEHARRYFGFALLPYLLVMFLMGLSNARTDNWSHLGGLLTGALLAALADPPGQERRPGWNGRWQAAVLGILTVCLAGLAVLGPRLVPLRDDQIAALGPRERPFAPEDDRPLAYAVPAGWVRASTPGVGLAWESPTGRSAWSVRAETARRPRGAEDALRSWLTRAEVDGLDLRALDGGPPLADLAAERGPEGLERADATVQTAHQRFTVSVQTRGIHELTTIWAVDRTWADHLAPLQARLAEAVAWRLPDEIARAEATWTHAPDPDAHRRRWARALAETGRPEEAAALWTDGLGEDVSRRPDWRGVLQLVAWYGDAVPAADAILERAFTADLGPREVVDLVEALERRLEAPGPTPWSAAHPDGVLLSAWWTWPGDRVLGVALRDRGLPWALTSAGTPRWGGWDERAGQATRPEAARWPLTPGAAEALGAERRRREATLRDAVDDPDPQRRAVALLLLRHGHPPPAVDEAWGEIRDALRASADGAEIPWLVRHGLDGPRAAALREALERTPPREALLVEDVRRPFPPG